MKPAMRNRGCAALLVLACGLAAGRALAADMTISQGAAHASHTQDHRVRGKLSCAECHAPVCGPTGSKNVAFGELAAAGGAVPSWDPASRTCSGVYCHGSGSPPVAWAYVYSPVPPAPSVECAACHGYPPTSHAASATSCNACHSGTVKPDGTIDIAGGRHVNGVLDFSGGAGGSGCASCHPFPPATGAHVAHFGLPGITAASYADVGTLRDRYPAETPTSAPAVYAFGCASCHSVDSRRHMNGTIDVVLHEADAPAGSLKARNAPTAAFDAAGGTCSGVYCHSSGQESPAYAGTPAWTSGTHLGCSGCHGNPPAYPTGAAGSATANSHLLLRVPMAGSSPQLYGHFTWHNRYAGATTEVIGKHGVPGEGAAPMTCQTCHAATVDPTATGRSGFYWLDTTGEYDLAGAALTYGCRTSGCHTGAPGGAPQGVGRVLPLLHVNGSRDVVFDGRTAAPSFDGLPAAPFTPDFPYWVSVLIFKDASVLPPGAAWNPPPPPTGAAAGTLSFRLDGAGYAPATKSCSSVACHLRQTSVQWGGANIGSYSTCFGCHTNH
ncbi:MAG: CxxxxCH/CxxCH domain-containing protein [Deltaproteobacteria bacterium]|nr:CxxxxCH/CxxCH domain-containing protein [Deltaproteobacteria bacterium]